MSNSHRLRSSQRDIISSLGGHEAVRLLLAKILENGMVNGRLILRGPVSLMQSRPLSIFAVARTPHWLTVKMFSCGKTSGGFHLVYSNSCTAKLVLTKISSLLINS